MMAAAQPFITGAISKTINLPNDATIADITECYRMSWELGLKANALYRDGCKLSQPLSATADEAKKEAGKDESSAKVEAVAPVVAPVVAPEPAAAESTPTEMLPIELKRDLPPSPRRRRLPDTRRSLTHKFNVAGHEGYLTVGLFEDGQPGELFITMSKEGSTIGGLMDSLGTATSISLQYGVPVSSLVNKFSHQRFEPAGMTENADIPFAKSLVDYIFRWMGMQFVEGYRESHSPRAQYEASSPVTSTRLQDEPRRIDTDRSVAVGAVRQSSAKPAIGGELAAPADAISRAAADAQADAPACDVCGSITVRSGTCYKCLNCGNSMGCS
jgi:ribonucleoside-diphosphate reductase alpha chain